MEVIILFIGEKRKLLKRCVADFSTLPFYIELNGKKDRSGKASSNNLQIYRDPNIGMSFQK
ncbi:hypothetical protein NM96_07950 [Neisseria mucosa]|jgi:hypothetical protein|uniref:Uncharacterized protein n=1 Tax=Neisseria mucosa TaxID=488 RepID=A0ABM6JEW9_NEIMU|nr:hypothetical protein A6J88_13525 [Neisseria mucosa]AVR79272.1 hypothetical protein NM96_07950 [Neisseria mucosa]